METKRNTCFEYANIFQEVTYSKNTLRDGLIDGRCKPMTVFEITNLSQLNQCFKNFV